MNKEDKELLEKHEKALIEQMSTEDLLDDLVEDHVFDNETKERIEEMASLEERGERLLKAVIESKNPNAMQSFLHTLDRTHDYLHALLKPSGEPDSRPLPLPIDQHEPHISPQPTSSPSHQKEFDEKLNENQLWEISDTFRFLEWKHLGRNLNLCDATLIEIKMKAGDDLREIAYGLLKAWKEHYPEKCTIGSLCEALHKLSKNDIKNKLKELAASEVFQNMK